MPIANNDTPFELSPAHLQRVRVRAYHLWESEGRPGGQSAALQERARELDALESYPPVPRDSDIVRRARQDPHGALIEEASLQENLGEFPSRLTDQGDTMPTPESREIAREFRDGDRQARAMTVNTADHRQAAVTAVTAADFERAVSQGDGPIAVEFMSYSCAHCASLAPVLDEAAQVLGSRVRIFCVNVATDPAIAERFGVQGTPTFVMFLDGRERGRVEGPAPYLSSVVADLKQPFGA